MESVFYFPRIGKNYHSIGYNGLKILILGESHYCGERVNCEICGKLSNRDDCNNFTISVLDDKYFAYKLGHAEFEDWMRTFTRFTNVFLGNQVNNEDLIDFWDSVIFYNYVQSSTLGPRKNPTQQQFEESDKAFFEVLDMYNPDLILVWGKRLWDNLNDEGRWGDNNILDDFGQKFYYYRINEREIPAYFVYHPSTSKFNYETTKYLKEVLRLVSIDKNTSLD